MKAVRCRLIPLPLALIATLAVADLDMASQQDDFLTESDFLGDIPTVSGATHLPQKLSETPAAVTIIDQEMIRASGALELVDLFRLVPGFQAYYVRGGQYGINYHIFAHEYPNRLEVKVDGRSVYESLLAATEWTTLGVELEDIDYIEVIRSPNAPADGSNAFTGTVNIVTKLPVTTSGLSLRAEAGDLQTRNASLVYSDQLGQLDYRATLRYRSNDGFPDPAEEYLEDSTETATLGFRGLWTPTLADTIDLQFGYSDSEVGLQKPVDAGEPQEASPREYRYHYQHVNWQRTLRNEQQVQLLFYHNFLDIHETLYLDRELEATPAELLFYGLTPRLDFDGESERYDLEFRHRLRLTDRLRMVWGMGARYDRVESELQFGHGDSIGEEFFRLFDNLEYSLGDATVVNAGLMLEHNAMIDSHYSARLAVNQHLTPDHTLRAAATRASRSPSTGDFHFDRSLTNQLDFVTAFPLVGAPGLIPAGTFIPAGELVINADQVASDGLDEEVVNNYEIGYFGQFGDGLITLDVKFFVEQYKDLIDETTDNYCLCELYDPSSLSQRGKIIYIDNTAALDTEGVEMQLVSRALDNVLLTLQYSYLNIEGERLDDFATPTAPAKIRQLDDRAPVHTGGLLVNVQLPARLEFSAHYYYQSEVDWRRGDFSDDYDRLDLRLAKRFDIGNTSGRVELLGHNVLDTDFQEFIDFNRFEPRYYARVVLEF